MKNLFVALMLTAILSGCYANEKISSEKNIYCSGDGTLTDTMPIQSHRSYCLSSNAKAKTFAANSPAEYSFAIIDDQGNTFRDFAITHTEPMHIIVIRKDLQHFQHLHPEFNEQTGQFTIPDLTFPADGLYRVFADFASATGQKDPMGTPLAITISEDISVGTNYSPQPIGSEEKAKTFDGYGVELSTDTTPVSGKEIMLTFDLKQNGQPVTDLEEYLGALGHSVILREGTLDFIHTHPVEDTNKSQNGKVNFMVYFPDAGKYKIFTQFQHNQKIVLTDFVVSVGEGVET